jgi:hypothetical protein
MEAKAQLIGRIGRRCADFFGALLEEFASIGLAHHGYPLELYHRREEALRNSQETCRSHEHASEIEEDESARHEEERSATSRVSHGNSAPPDHDFSVAVAESVAAPNDH